MLRTCDEELIAGVLEAWVELAAEDVLETCDEELTVLED